MENKTNKILIICNAVLLLGLIGIYVLHFTSTPKSKVNTAATEPLQKEGGLTVAYIDSDTLLAKYQYAIDLQKELEAYRKAPHRPDTAELRAAFGEGATVMDIITGETFRV